MLNLESLSKDLGAKLAEKLDEPIADGVLQTVVGEAIKLVGGALLEAGTQLVGAENADADA